ncbi:heavy metal translocating P-type ATPase [Acidipropionibacterium acidipropionici]|jgi:heavy metal translocating P-type ATPase|uniref:P-type ATPase A domain-containing protein n=2 Tax=Acidipropionibacterium acidipropionici TaxID=1748 RepID=A0ABN4U2W5_9ACTN|nr:hypothetical protein A8L58_04080 [Acidipropionibacterium acidipropionici]AZP37945.1 heavy metal translocating P-type ATPase [Acidipropionibacterium acidipropionici]
MRQALSAYPLVAVVALTGAVGGACALLGATDAARTVISVVCLALAVRLVVGMVHELRAGSYGVDLLAIIAIVSTVLVGEHWASLVICLMLTGGEALEDHAQNRAKRSLTALLDNAPTTATRILADSGPEQVPVEDIVPGDRIQVLPGELVGVDGTLLAGTSRIDESSLTGEPMPVLRRPGDQVMAGSVNGSAAIVMRADAGSADSQYQRIIAMVRSAQASRAPFVAMADRIAVPFTAVSLLIAALAWIISGDPGRFAAVLVVATPCPLIIAAPVAFMAGMNRAARAGIIVRDSGSLERLAEVRTAAFDKTGTLTCGEPAVTAVIPVEGREPDEVLAVAAAAEAMSTHPLARAVVAEAARRGLKVPHAEEAEQIVSSGVSARIGGRPVRVGGAAFAMGTGDFAGRDLQVAAGGAPDTHVHVWFDGSALGVIEVSDPVRPEAGATLEELSELGITDTLMLTGDAQLTAERVAGPLGITDVRAGLRPEDKLAAVAGALGPVMMVGDGVNDAPVLAAADIGVAMGAKGSAAAVESADVIIMEDDLLRVGAAVEIGRRTVSVARQAIGIGIGLSLALMIVGASGVMPPVIGAGAQELVDLTCILWALGSARPSRRPTRTVEIRPAEGTGTTAVAESGARTVTSGARADRRVGAPSGEWRPRNRDEERTPS